MCPRRTNPALRADGRPPLVTLVRTEACHFCNDAHAELRRLADDGLIVLEEHDAESPTGKELISLHRPAMFPLVLIDGSFFSSGRLPGRKLAHTLTSRK